MTLTQWQAQAQYLEFNTLRVAYWQGGDWQDDQRPALLLIHGFPTASFDWDKIWAPLCERYRVLAIDMLGFGYSAKPRDLDYAITMQADLLAHVASICPATQWHVLAHDYGDTVAQELLARHNGAEPNRLSMQTLCLLNGGLFPETHRATRMQKLLHSPLGGLIGRAMNANSFRRSFVGVFGAATQPTEAELVDYWSQIAAHGGTHRIIHRLIRYIQQRREFRARWVGALEQTAVPLRVICGADDPVSGRHMAARYSELVPKPDVVLLDGIGHYPQCEAPTAVLAALHEFHAASGA